jgi:SpoVK/Ycf46/Vps4 family AAA+-type ATPase
VIAAELAGRVTVLFCEASVVSEHLEELYAELVHLGPSLVVLEDIDLVVGQRTSGSGRALLGFLTALDGVMSQHKDVITVATTNDPKALDAAAKRAARFDRLIEVPLPCIEARATILARYLGEVAERVDVGAVAQATNGASGADLRELVRRSVLEYGDDLTTSRLLRLVDTGAWHDPSVIGLYL